MYEQVLLSTFSGYLCDKSTWLLVSSFPAVSRETNHPTFGFSCLHLNWQLKVHNATASFYLQFYLASLCFFFLVPSTTNCNHSQAHCFIEKNWAYCKQLRDWYQKLQLIHQLGLFLWNLTNVTSFQFLSPKKRPNLMKLQAAGLHSTDTIVCIWKGIHEGVNYKIKQAPKTTQTNWSTS